MPATTAPQSTCWTLESKLGITVRVSLSSTLNSDECTNEPEPDTSGHHFILTGAATSANHPRFELSHDHLSAIARTMLEQIKSVSLLRSFFSMLIFRPADRFVGCSFVMDGSTLQICPQALTRSSNRRP